LNVVAGSVLTGVAGAEFSRYSRPGTASEIAANNRNVSRLIVVDLASSGESNT
jgi:hypothetical protein